MNYCVIRNDELYHHGILGQKWGVRRYQNEDGSLTPAGERRYYGGETTGGSEKLENLANKMLKERVETKTAKKKFDRFEKQAVKEEKKARNRGHEEAAKKMAAGRIYAKALFDSQFREWSISQAVNMAMAKTGKTYINEMLNYRFDRADDIGGIKVTVDGITIEIADMEKKK